jgi:sortase A
VTTQRGTPLRESQRESSGVPRRWFALPFGEGRGTIFAANKGHERSASVERSAPMAGLASRSRFQVEAASQILGIFAVLALSFLIELSVLGNLRHDRDQAKLAMEFRSALANAVAPVGPLDDSNKPVAAGTPVAILEMSRLQLREVVVEGTSSRTLMSGPGHRRDTPLPGQVGNSVIVGRRATYGGPFKSIDQLRAGDQITVITGQGKSSFAVLRVRHAGDPLPPPLSRGQGRLTLVTADGPPLRPTDVLRVDAALVSTAQPRPAQLPSQVLPAADALMAGDSSALLDVVGWSVLLVAGSIIMVWTRFRVGFWQAWIIGLPVLVVLALAAFDDIAAMLPNLL